MISNLEKYKKDLDRLVSDGDNLLCKGQIRNGEIVNREEQFSILFRKHGIPAQVDGLPSDTKKRYEQQIGFYNAFDPNIYVGAVENMSFNAVASKNATGEFIALYAGAITQLTLYA
jgi:hypothetical protein